MLRSLILSLLLATTAVAITPEEVAKGSCDAAVKSLETNPRDELALLLKAAHCIPPPPPPVALTLTKAGTGDGTLTGAGIYPLGTVVPIGATPASDSTFAGWGGDADCADGKVTMTGPRTCVGAFTLATLESRVTPTPTSLLPLGTLTVEVVNAAPTTVSDWVGIYSQGQLGAWQYLGGGTATPPAPLAKATLTFTAPQTTGSYEVRLYPNNTTTKPKATAPFVVAGTNPPPPIPPPGAVELPRVRVDLTLVPPTGSTIVVPAGGNAQAALDAATCGDVVKLTAGATYTPGLILRAKSCDGWITLTSTATDLPTPGNRVIPADAPKMPKVLGTTNWNYGPALLAAPGAHHYRIIGVEFAPTAGAIPIDLVALGYTETARADVPHHIILDRVYIHGSPTLGGRRGVVLHGAHIGIVDSYISDWKLEGFDAQAVCGWNAVGPIRLQNNYLEGSAENINFGGAIPTIPGLVPADIEIVGNYIAKPDAWRSVTPPWMVKNLLELKSAQRVLIKGNVFERVWAHAQVGFVFMFSPRVDSGKWAIVSDITIEDNIIRSAARGVAISGYDTGMPQSGGRYLIRNNVWMDIGPPWGDGWFAMVNNQAADVTLDRNTSSQSSSVLVSDVNAMLNPRFRFTNNVAPHNQYGVWCGRMGTACLDFKFPPWTFTGNVLFGPAAVANAGAYPAGNSLVLTPGPIPPGVGADMAVIQAATACVVSGQCAPAKRATP